MINFTLEDILNYIAAETRADPGAIPDEPAPAYEAAANPVASSESSPLPASPVDIGEAEAATGSRACSQDEHVSHFHLFTLQASHRS